MLVNHSPTVAVLSSTDLIHLLAFAIITTHCAGTCTQFLPKGTMGALPDTEDLTFASADVRCHSSTTGPFAAAAVRRLP